jgi:hypothetical protein
MPLVARALAEQILFPLGVVSMLLVFLLVMRRAMASGTVPHWQSAVHPIK